MNKAEVEQLLIWASAVDNRVVTDLMIDAWHAAIGRLSAADALAALNDFRRVATTEYLVPGHITQHVNLIRARHAEIHGIHPPPPPGKRWAVDVIENDPALGSAP